MNSCCTLPLEVIAADQHKKSDECCFVTEKTSAPPKAECPISKTPSRKVQKRTLEHLLKPEKVGSIQNVQYYYCADSNCHVVYFSNENVPSFTIDDIAVKVLSKDATFAIASIGPVLESRKKSQRADTQPHRCKLLKKSRRATAPATSRTPKANAALGM
ncbi:MAG: hypothetical protein HY088_00115 [Ignavibacteriales bacterium]|nr:hypothetical protein [Ignavibacteriales bacterium]